MNTSTRLLTVVVAAAASIGLVAGPALAANPHFVSVTATASGTDLNVSFKEAGLGGGSQQNIRAEADYTAVFQCINGGGKNPSAANKSTETGSTATSGVFRADRNGNVVGSLKLSAPSVVTNDLVCPNGQREQLSQITWSSVGVADLTSGARLASPFAFSFGTVL